MKKIIIMLAMLFSISCYAADTTYFCRKEVVYMKISMPVTDSTTYLQYIKQKEIKKRREKRENRISFGVFILTLILIWK